MTSIGLMGPGVGILCLTFIGCNPSGAVIILCCAVMLSGASLSGYNLNQIELSPNYAGTLRGASSTVANICGFATPAVVGIVTNGQVCYKMSLIPRFGIRELKICNFLMVTVKYLRKNRPK
jgi:hypothetical protein